MTKRATAASDLVAEAEATGVNEILWFNRATDRVPTVTRREP
jgi:hypothetical protein